MVGCLKQIAYIQVNLFICANNHLCFIARLIEPLSIYFFPGGHQELTMACNSFLINCSSLQQIVAYDWSHLKHNEERSSIFHKHNDIVFINFNYLPNIPVPVLYCRHPTVIIYTQDPSFHLNIASQYKLKRENVPLSGARLGPVSLK